MLAFSSAILAGLFGFFFTGAIHLELKVVKKLFGDLGVKATGGMALFVLVLVWWLSPFAPVGTEKKLADIQQGVENVSGKIDAISVAIHEKIGSANLGPEYDKVNYHRDYQDEYLKKGGKIESLITEYRAKVDKTPGNAMYRYLLARIYDLADMPLDARSEAEIGVKADERFFWNRRFLLYYLFQDPFDLHACLELERKHYQISAAEKKMFDSGSPRQFMKAFVEIKDRFRKDSVITNDLEKRHLCWHLFKAQSDMSYANGKAFKDLIGMEAIGVRNTVKLKVLDVKTGTEAFPLIKEMDLVYLRTTEKYEPIGQTGLIRTLKVPERVGMTKGRMMELSFMMPPVAIRLALQPIHPSIDLTTLKDRSFFFAAHCDPPPPEVAKDLFGGLPQIDPRLILPISKYEMMDVKHLFTPKDYWVCFFGIPVPWRTDDECAIQLDYTVCCGSQSIRAGDTLHLWNRSAKNLVKAPTDAAETIDRYQQIMKMPIEELKAKGCSITNPMEGMVSQNFKKGMMSLQVLGFQDMEVELIYSSEVHKSKNIKTAPEGVGASLVAGTRLKLSWPLQSVQQMLSSQRNGDWVRFTGTAVYQRGGKLYVIPKSASPVK